MYKLMTLVMTAAVLAAPPLRARADVIWTFYETGITECGFGTAPNQCVLPPQPYALGTLTLPSATSSGTADWSGMTGTTPSYTGDSFSLNFPPVPLLSSAFEPVPGQVCGQSAPPTVPCLFHVSWSETGGTLNGVSIVLVGEESEIGVTPANEFAPFGLDGGWIGSDGTIGGCTFTTCEVTGFWQSNLVPEPASAALLTSGLFGIWMAGSPRSRRAASRRSCGSRAAPP